MAKKLNVDLAFTANTSQAKAQLQDLQNQLSRLTATANSGTGLGLTKDIAEATSKVAELQSILQSATTSTGRLDLGAFTQGIKKSGTDLKEYARILNSLGPEGSQAFASLARSITTAEIPLRKVNGLLSEMWTTMKNTARWQLTSSVLHGFIGGLQSAVGYAKDLNKTLTDIRIVAPEKSMEDMYKFSKLANKQAKELSSTTLDYAKGALIYYQQGLDDVTTQERTDVTTKMANVTGDSVDEVSSYMTAIWNNFNKEGDQSAEHFADILTKLGAETAANTTEITTALEKYTGVANTIGLSYESATAAATTLIDRMRETPEVAGTALKTIFARMEGLKLEGSTDEGGTTTDLNKYSTALHQIGVEIKDANGDIREADEILMDIGEKWNSGELSQDVKIATAETVAGIRQWQQFAALMDNFDYFKQYKDMAAFGSDGSLQEQQDIYAESWEAAANRVTTAIQSIYMQLLDDKFFIKMLNTIADVIDGISKVIDGMGGLKAVLPLVGTLMLKAFGSNIAKSMENIAYNIKIQRKGYEEILQQRKIANEALKDTLINYGNQGVTNNAQAAAYEKQANVQSTLISKQEKLNSLNRELTAEEAKQAELLLDIVANRGQDVIKTAEELENNQKSASELQRRMETSMAVNVRNNKKGSTYNAVKGESFSDDIAALKQLEEESNVAYQAWERFGNEFRKGLESGNDEQIKNTQEELKLYMAALEETGAVSEETRTTIKNFFNSFTEGQISSKDIEQVDSDIQNLAISAEQLYQDIEGRLNKAFADSPKLLQQFETELEELKEKFRSGAITEEELIQKTKELGLTAEQVGENINNFKGKIPTASDGMVALASSIMQVSMALTMIRNLDDIWKNDDLSEGEKMFETFTNLAMILPIVTSLINKNNIANLAALPAAISASMGYMTEAEAEELLAGANVSLAKSFKALWTTMAPLIPFLIIGAAAIAGIVIAAKSGYNAMHKFEQQFEHAQETAKRTTEVYNEVKGSIDEVGSAIENLNSKQQTLENLTAGTKEWRNALNDVSEAGADVKLKIDELAKSNEVTDYFAKNKQFSQDVVDENGDVISTVVRSSGTMQYGIDYVRDLETGSLVLTEAGEQWANILQEIAETQLSITNNAAQMQESFTSVSASTEKIRNNFGNFQNIEGAMTGNPTLDGVTEQYLKSGNRTTLGQELTMDIIEQISNLLASEKLTADDFEDTERLAQLAGISDELAEEIIKNEELKNALIENGQAVRANTEATKTMASNDLLSDKSDPNGLYQKIYGENSEIDKKYRAGLVDYMGEEVIRSTKQGISDEDWSKNQQSYKEQYAERNHLTYDSKKDVFKDEEGEKTNVSDEDIKNLIAYNKSLEEVNNNLDLYEKILKDTKKDNKSLANIKEIWDNQSSAIKEASKEIKENKKAWKNLDEDLKNGIAQTATEIHDELAQALDIEDKDGTILDGQFLAENAEDIEKALDGDVEALSRLTAAAAEKMVLDISAQIDDDEIQDKISALNKEISSMNQDIKINTELSGDDEFLQKCQEIVNAAGMTQEQASDYLQALGFDATIETAEEPPEDFIQHQPRIDIGSKEAKFRVPSLSLSGMMDGFGGESAVKWTDISFNVPDIKFGGTDTAKETVGGFKASALKITNMKKTNGGNIKKASSSSGRRTGGGNRGSGSRGGGRGSGSRTTARATKGYEKSTVLERYKEITDKLDQNSRVSERLAKVQDKLYGKNRLDQMDKVNKKHLEEISLLRKKANEAQDYYKQDKAEMEKRLKEALDIVKTGSGFSSKYLTTGTMDAIKNITGFTYGDFGNITNYTQIMTALQNELNELENMYNNFKGTKENQDKFKEEKITPVAEAINRLKEAIDQYDETRELIEELKDQIEEAYTQWQDTNYEKLTYSLELKVTVNDNELKYLENKLNSLSDNVYKAAESLDYYFSNTTENKLNLTTRAISDYTEHIKELTEEYLNNTITQAKYIEGLQSSYEALLSNVNTLQDLKKEMTEYYGKTLDSVINELDKYNDRLDTSSSLISHLQSILDLTGKSTNYDLIERLQNAQAVTDTTALNTAKAIYDLAAKENEEKQAAYIKARDKALQMMALGGPEDMRAQEIAELEAKLAAGGSTDELVQYKQRLEYLQSITDETYRSLIEDTEEMAKKQAEAAVEAYESAQDQMFSSVEEALEHAAEGLETALNRAADAMEKALSRMVGGFDELLRRMNLTSTRQDEYLTKTNQSYELNKMYRTLNKDMEATDSKAAKAKLANFAKELDVLTERDELSNLELEIMQKKYELLKAQIALEDSRNAKNVIRLSRDNEGNYGYVYVANEQEVDDATQAVEDAKNDLYNLQLNATNEYGQKYIQATQEYQNSLKDFYNSDEYKQLLAAGNQEAINERINAIQKQYNALVKTYEQLYNVGLYSTDYLVAPLKNDAWMYNTYNDYIDNITSSLPSAISSFIGGATGAGEVYSTQLGNITKYVNFDDRMNTIITDTETTMNTLAKDFEVTGERLIIVLDQVSDKLQTFIDETLPALDKSIADTTSVIESVKTTIKDAAENNVEQPAANFNKFMQLLAGSNASSLQYDDSTHVAYTTSGTYGMNASQAASLSLQTIAKNEVIAGQLIKLIEEGHGGFFGFDKNGNMSYITGVSSSDANYKNWVSKNGIVRAVKVDKFDTGGYTGEWSGTQGRFAMLHEKELVLNEQDTRNILDVVKGVRALAAGGFLSALTPGSANFELSKAQSIDQQVKIDAQFPNVTDRYEIEQAFNNLVNRASQHAYTNKK